MKRSIATIFIIWLGLLVAGCGEEKIESITVNGKLYLAGIDYTVLDEPIQIDYQPVTNVIEFFWYGCPHCARFEPLLQEWKENSAPQQLRFIRVPAVWNELMIEHASAYFMARKYKMVDQVHGLLFQRVMSMNIEKDIAVHQRKIRAFFIEHGLSASEYDSFRGSKEMTEGLISVQQFLRKAKISSTPSFLVNGKYVLNTSTFSSADELFSVINALIEQESDRFPSLM